MYCYWGQYSFILSSGNRKERVKEWQFCKLVSATEKKNFFLFFSFFKWKQKYIQKRSENKKATVEQNKIFTSYLRLYLSSLWLTVKTQRQHCLSRDTFEDPTIVLAVLARREYRPAVVARQIAAVSLMHTPKPWLAGVCCWTQMHSSKRDNFLKVLTRNCFCFVFQSP